MKGLLNLFQFIQQNWGMIVAILTAAWGVYQGAKREYAKWQRKSDEQKIEEAKKALASIVLKLCSEAEIAWSDAGSKLGPIKRSEVISACFEKYPVLLTVTNIDEIMDYIDSLIEEALKVVRESIRV